jgi:hypothetical protein
MSEISTLVSPDHFQYLAARTVQEAQDIVVAARDALLT